MPLIIPIFVVHQGCPHRCIYCNEEKAVGEGACPSRITEASFRETVNYYLGNSRRKKGPAQIAFYGGNFTGIDREYQRELLEMAGAFIRQGSVESIRISTRPDCIDETCLDFLEGFSVKTVEIGAQSMMDDVLRLSDLQGSVESIRISTRPDCIDETCLDFLEGFSVKTVEIGAQSMMDDVLRL